MSQRDLLDKIQKAFRLEWGVQYETACQPKMDGTTEETTVQVFHDRKFANRAIQLGLPLSGRNHRLVRRYVTEWEPSV